MKESNFPTSRTEKVLEKWSTEGEINKESIRKAANQYAKLEVNNRILKWIIVAVVTFLFVLLGFMIASVVLGVNITKEVKVKDGQLVATSGNNSVVKTSTVKYHNKISLNSPSSVIDTLTSITVTISDGIYEGVLQFEVVSYVFVPGKKLTFYGHSHQADVMPDGSVKLTNLLGGKRDGSDSTTGTGVDGVSHTNGVTNVNLISSCADLANIQTTGSYEFTTDLDCSNLQLPLLSGQVFNGILNGNGKRLKLTYSSTSRVALFDTIGGSVNGVLLEGSLSGVDQCAGFAVRALTGSFFSRNSNYATITCTEGTNNQAGSFFAVVEPLTSTDTNVVTIDRSVGQARITFNSPNAVVGGFYGRSSTAQSIVSFTFSTTDAVITTTGQSFLYGALNTKDVSNAYKYDCPDNTKNYIVVPVGEAVGVRECGSPIEQCPNNPDYYNCDSTFCYACRDKSTRNAAKRSFELRKTPDNVQITPNFPKDVCY